jgi:hypothetical protein
MWMQGVILLTLPTYTRKEPVKDMSEILFPLMEIVLLLQPNILATPEGAIPMLAETIVKACLPSFFNC